MIWESCWTTNSTDLENPGERAFRPLSSTRWGVFCVVGSDRPPSAEVSLYWTNTAATTWYNINIPDRPAQVSTGSRSAFLRGDSPRRLGALLYIQWRIPIFSSQSSSPQSSSTGANWGVNTTNKNESKRNEEVVLQILGGWIRVSPLSLVEVDWRFNQVCVWGTKQLKFCTVRVNASLTEQFKRQWKCSATFRRGSGKFKRPQSALQSASFPF